MIIRFNRIIAIASFMAVLFYSCKNKSMLNRLYVENKLPNVHWRYFLYEKKSFSQAISQLNALQSKRDKAGILNIVDTLLMNIDRDYDIIKSDRNFFLFMQYVNNGDSAKRYVDLYYNLAKSKISSLKDSVNQSLDINFDELREYYVRYAASAFFKEAWFYVTKYHATEGFFKVFIDDEVFNHLSYPEVSTEYLKEDMYLNVVLGKHDAGRIAKNVSNEGFLPKNLQLNDSVFYEGLQGVLNDQFILVYNYE